MEEQSGAIKRHVQSSASTIALLAIRGENLDIAVGDLQCDVVQVSGPFRVYAFLEGESALSFAIRALTQHPRASAGLLLGNVSELAIQRARALAEYGDSGQLVITLAMQDLVRDCDQQLSFLEIGSTELVGRLERVFLVSRPSEANHESALGRTSKLQEEASLRSYACAGSFIGRRNDMARLSRALDLSKLVTLHGGPGTGKSALLRRFFFESERTFEDGGWLIDLGHVRHGDLVVPTLCHAIGALKLPSEERADALASSLRTKKALLVLDNCQATISTVRLVVSRLLHECSHLAIIIGSRRPTKASGETRLLLQGLETPAFAEDWRSIREYDSVVLFEERAQAYDATFKVSALNASDVALLCQKLDGVPLAIELAASKAALLTPRQILGRLADRFLLLKDESGTQRLEETIEWSYQLLSPNARLLLTRLSVFYGSFSVDSAETVCAGEELGSDAFLGTFEELLDNSLITPSASEFLEKDFYLTESVRAFAASKLKLGPNKPNVEANHRHWCLAFASNATEGLYSTNQTQWLNAMDAAYEDMRAVVSSGCLPRGDLELAGQILIACWPYLMERNFFREGFMMAEKIVNARGAEQLADFPRLLNICAAFAYYLSELTKTRAYALRSVREARRRKDVPLEGRAHCTLGMAAQGGGRNARARRHYLRAAAAMRGNDENRLLTVLGNLIGVETLLGMFESAAAHLDEAKRLEERSTCKSTRTSMKLNAAHLAFSTSDNRLAWTLSLDCLDGAIEHRDDLTLALILRTFVRLLWQDQQAEFAAVLIGAGQCVLACSEAQPTDEGPITFQATCSEIEQHLGAEAYEERVLEGRLLDREAVLSEVRQVAIKNC